MTRPTIYVAITNHGYGHATRMAAVLAEIVRRCPDILLIIVTTAPRSLLESYIGKVNFIYRPRPLDVSVVNGSSDSDSNVSPRSRLESYLGDVNFIYRPRPLDVGVIQSDGLTMDKERTRLEIERIQHRERMIIAGEVNFIRLNRVQLVLADIPPLAASIAKAAGIPCWMISNFGWDFIYQSWGAEFAEIVQWIQNCFRQCDRLFRLPFHEPMSIFSERIDVGLTGGSPWYEPDYLRQELGITTPNDRTVLLTFGGLGLQSIPYANLARFPDWQFLTFDRQAPSLPNLIKIEHPYRPVDVMPLCHCIISKPGYGTFSEACRVGVPIITLTREDFPESLLLLEGIQNHAAHRIISPLNFFQGSWDFLHQPLIQPLRSPSVPALRQDGNETIAQAVVDFLS